MAGHRSAVHPLHLGNHRRPQGCGAGQRRPRRGAGWTMENIYDVGPGDVMWTASDVGWVVGHSYIVYGPLLAGATTVLYEGKPVGTPDAGAFWRVVEDHASTSCSPRPRHCGPSGRPIRSPRESETMTSRPSGRCSPRASAWTRRPTDGALRHSRCPWSTIGGRRRPDGPSAPTRSAWSSSRSKPVRPLFPCRASAADRRRRRRPVPAGVEGNIVLRLPLPPGTLTTLWGNDERYISSYLQVFEGFYTTGDSGYSGRRRLSVRDGTHR